MNLRGQTYTERTTVAPPPINLEAGRLEPKAMLLLEGVGFAALFFAFLFMQLGAALGRAIAYGDYFSWTQIGSGGAWLIGGLLASVGLYMIALPLIRERQHAKRVDAYSQLHMQERRKISGVVTEKTFSQFEYRATRVDHILVLALIAYRTRAWSVETFRNPMFIGSRRVADRLSEKDARMVPQILADIGIIRNRQPGYAGELAVDSADDVLELVWRNSNKIQNANYNELEVDDE